MAEVDDRTRGWLSKRGTKSVDHYHRELGKIVWEYCGMARNRTGLEKALSEIPALREEFRTNVKVLGSAGTTNQSLEQVNRVDDFMEMAELKVRDALHREESCGGHFRRSTRPPRARPCATTTTSPTWPPGTGRARTGPRSWSRSRWSSRT